MASIQYIGETLWPGHLGHICIILSFVSALFTALAAYMHLKQKSTQTNDWGRLCRVSYSLHSVATFTLIALIFYVMGNSMYEYSYVHEQVSDELPMKYIFSAFWAGQEGSFLLWMFWHAVLGMIFVVKNDKWTPQILFSLGLIEAFLASMLLGIHIPLLGEEYKIGSNPTLLIRDVIDAPIFATADYLTQIEGKGLNPLLQNYWMTIHPPVLFLGFASTAIPFAFAIGSLLTRDYRSWLVPGLKWALFSAFILGTGILMGAAWAYEALTFGGYWAWDPVENASLVPWIIIVAGVHTNLIARNTGYSVRATYAFYLLTFILIVYSTFLTRSGILGETSAHAFTEMGLEWQLVAFITFFILQSLYFYLTRRSAIPTKVKEEAFTSREFWMLIGSLVLFFSATLITVSTSLPVYNTVREAVWEPGFIGKVIEDPIEHYNKYQLWIGVFVALLSGTSQFLRYGARNWNSYRKKFGMHIGISLLIAAALSYPLYLTFHDRLWQHLALTFAGVFAISSNLDYLISVLKGNLKAGAAVVSHMGFGILIFGTLYSGLNKEAITKDPFAQAGITNSRNLNTNVTLIKNSPIPVNDYWIEYRGDSIEGNLKKFDLTFTKVDDKNKKIEEFTVRPSAIYDTKFSKISAWNPDTKHYWNKDIFTLISGYPKHLNSVDSMRVMEDTMKWEPMRLALLESDSIKDFTGQFMGYTFSPNQKSMNLDSADMAVGAIMKFKHPRMDSIFTAEPALVLKQGLVYQHPVTIDPLGMRIALDESVFDKVFTEEIDLQYQDILLKEGETKRVNGISINLAGFDKQIDVSKYQGEEGDIAIAAILDVVDDATGKSYRSEPIYILRQNKQFSIKDYIAEAGLHIRFNKIDPTSQAMTFSIAKEERDLTFVNLNVAPDVPRSDIIAIESLVFPGINLVWLGTCMMLLGLLMGLIVRFKHT